MHKPAFKTNGMEKSSPFAQVLNYITLRWNMALTDAAIVVSREPNNTKAWIRLGKALRSVGRGDEAIRGMLLQSTTTIRALFNALNV